jgi:hypothetical protein
MTTAQPVRKLTANRAAVFNERKKSQQLSTLFSMLGILYWKIRAHFFADFRFAGFAVAPAGAELKMRDKN